MTLLSKGLASFTFAVITASFALTLSWGVSAAANNDKLFKQVNNEVPKRTEGEGTYDRLVIRGGYVIDGTGAPPYGPTDIVVEQNRITQIKVVGFDGLLAKFASDMDARAIIRGLRAVSDFENTPNCCVQGG